MRIRPHDVSLGHRLAPVTGAGTPFTLHKTSFLASLGTLPNPCSPGLMTGFPRNHRAPVPVALQTTDNAAVRVRPGPSMAGGVTAGRCLWTTRVLCSHKFGFCSASPMAHASSQFFRSRASRFTGAGIEAEGSDLHESPGPATGWLCVLEQVTSPL